MFASFTMAALPQLLPVGANIVSTYQPIWVSNNKNLFLPFIALNVINRVNLLAKLMTLFGHTVIPNNNQVLSIEYVFFFVYACTEAQLFRDKSKSKRKSSYFFVIQKWKLRKNTTFRLIFFIFTLRKAIGRHDSTIQSITISQMQFIRNGDDV